MQVQMTQRFIGRPILSSDEKKEKNDFCLVLCERTCLLSHFYFDKYAKALSLLA